MVQDKYSSIWVSHSSINDFLKCPRSYFLKNIYKNQNNRKINIVSPALSLGSAVHEVLEGLLNYKAEDRFKKPLLQTYEENWHKYAGKMGGFKSIEEENAAKERGIAMISRVVENPGLLTRKAVKLQPAHNNMPPNFFLSEEDNIILNGKIDWLEYIPEDNSIRVVDFKTGKNDEDKDSLQLPIYALLLNALQKRKVSGAAYWYLERNEIVPVNLPNVSSAHARVLAIAKKVKEAREKKEFNCPRGPQGCFACQPFEKVLRGEAEFIDLGNYGQELYMI